MATAPSSDNGEFQDAMTFSTDESGSDSDSSSSTSTLEVDGMEYPRLGKLMKSVGVQQDAVAVISAEKKQLSKKIERFGVKKLKYENEMVALVKMANDLTEEENKLEEQFDALKLLKSARLGEARKKVAELEYKISGLKGKIKEVKLESKKYDEIHKAVMEEISRLLILQEPLFRDGGTAVINYGDYCVKEMEKSSKDLTSRE